MSAWIHLLTLGALFNFGAEWFGGSRLTLRIPRLAIGLTVVAHGTSAPEVIVGVQAARDADDGVAAGIVLSAVAFTVGRAA